MATFTQINAAVVNPSAAPLNNAMTAASDGFAADFGAKYLIRFTNGSAVASNIVLDDPTAVSPVGATAFNPDVTVAMPGVAGSVREMYVDATRFRNASTGLITWTYSASMVNAASLVEITRVG